MDLSFNVKDFEIPAPLSIGIGIGGFGLVYVGYNNWKHCMARRKLTNLRKQKQLERENAFLQLELNYNISPELLEVIEYPLQVLIAKLQNRELSAVQVLEAYLAKSIRVTREFNCITEYVPWSMEIAKDLDALEMPKGPLHGVPFCVKDDTDLEGIDTTVGYSKNLYKPAKASAVLVQSLIDLGAVPFCKTNTPQTCISFASHNPIFGKTLNPHNKSMSPGGSSSGTGGLVSGKGAPFGTGSDTGGSLRVPAHFNGISTIKPSKNRLSRKGLSFCVENCIGFPSVGSILAKEASEVASIFQHLTANNLQNSKDPKVVPVPWNEKLFNAHDKPLRIGYYTSHKIFPTIGDMESTVLRAKQVLESNGHTLIKFEDGINSVQAMKLCSQLLNADMGSHLLKALENDEISPVLGPLVQSAKTPIWIQKLFNTFPFSYLHQYSWIGNHGPEARFSSNLWDLMAERKAITEKFLNKMNELDLDLIICPPASFPAIGVDDVWKIPLDGFPYTMIYNLLDLPAGIVRFGVESGKNIEAETNINPLRRFAIQCVKKSVGMPIGVQIVGKPYMEEIVLRGMVELEKYCQGQETMI